jgi:predicted dehydrogenase
MSAMTQMQTPVPVAVVGVGRMGRHHARIYHQLPGATLVGIVDADLERAGTLAEQYACDAFEDVESLLAACPQLRGVSIAVPTAVHEEVARPLLQRRIACLVEKPLAPSVADARRLVELARDHDALLQVGHTERFNPAVRAIADWDLTPRFIESDRVSPMSFRSIDVGVVFDMMIHDLDIILMMVRSELKEVRACGVSVLGQHEDIADARLEFADGCVAKITASRLALKTERKLRVFSESGYISLDYAAKSGMAIQRTGNVDQLRELRKQIATGADLSDLDYTDLVNIQPLTINDEEPLRAELENFLAAIAGHSRPAVDAAAGLAAVEVAEQVVEQIRRHQWTGIDLERLV